MHVYLHEEKEIGREGEGMGKREEKKKRCISQHAAGAALPSALPPANTCLHFAPSALLALRSSGELWAP